MFAVAIIFGVNYVVARGVMVKGVIEPNAFILLRAIGAVILFFSLHRSRYLFTRREHLRLVLCGLTGIATNQLLFFNGLKLSGPIQSSLIMTTTPVLVYLLSIAFALNTWKWHKGLGILVGVVGVALIIFSDEIELGGIKLNLEITNQASPEKFEHAVLGNIMIFGNALSYAIYLIIAKPLMSKHPPVLVLKYVFLYGLLFILPFSISSASRIQFSAMGGLDILSILYVILLTTYLAYRLNGFALSQVNSTIVSIYLYLQPLVATLISISIGVEPLTGLKIMAGLLILVSIILVSLEKFRIFPSQST